MSENERWTIGGGYDGAHHAMFVFGGPQLPPCEHIDVVPASRLQEAEERREALLEAEARAWAESERWKDRAVEAEEALRRIERAYEAWEDDEDFEVQPGDIFNTDADFLDYAGKVARSALAALGEATGQQEERSTMGDGDPCMSCGGNDGYGPTPYDGVASLTEKGRGGSDV